MIYRLKHKPTGLYYQPSKHRGSHFSKKGKIYHSELNALTSIIKSKKEIFTIFIMKNSVIHKQTKGILEYKESLTFNKVVVDTFVKDWEREYILNP